MESTLLIWEEVPEDTSLYLIPNEVLHANEDWFRLLMTAHNHLVNTVGWEGNEGLAFLNAALTPEAHKDDESYFSAEQKKEWRCVFAKYKQNKNMPIEGVQVTRIVFSGFVM